MTEKAEKDPGAHRWDLEKPARRFHRNHVPGSASPRAGAEKGERVERKLKTTDEATRKNQSDTGANDGSVKRGRGPGNQSRLGTPV